MLQRSFIFIVAMALLAFQKPPKPVERVVFFGDSITEMGVDTGGYVARLREALDRKRGPASPQLIGAGIGGNKVYDLYLRMDDDVLARRPDAVVIWVGVNDVWHKKSFGTGTDADKFEKFYRAILKKLAAESIRVALVTPAAVGEKPSGQNPLDADLDAYSAIIRRLGRQFDLPVVDLRAIFMQNSAKNNSTGRESGLLTTDGVHLNAAGNQLVADEMLRLFEHEGW